MGLMLQVEEQQENIKDVLKVLGAKPCTACRLHLIHDTNRGVMARGNPEARLAVLVDYPGDTDMDNGVPLVGERGKIFDKWLRFLELDGRKDVFVLPLVHCQPPHEKKKQGKRIVIGEQLPPHKDDINTCFPSHTLRLLKAMPNLQAIMCIGWQSAEAILGKNWNDDQRKLLSPGPKSHEGNWFFTTIMPGVAVFCAPAIEDFVGGADMAKKGWLQTVLTHFKREFVKERKVVRLAKEENERYERHRYS